MDSTGHSSRWGVPRFFFVWELGDTAGRRRYRRPSGYCRCPGTTVIVRFRSSMRVTLPNLMPSTSVWID